MTSKPIANLRTPSQERGDTAGRLKQRGVFNKRDGRGSLLGFPRIRYFGFLANRRRGQLLPLCRTLLCERLAARETSTVRVAPSTEHAIWQCPRCQGPMQVLERLTALQILSEHCSQVYLIDSS